MPYWKHIPAFPLSQFVACFWYWEGVPQTPAKERLMPTGEPCIIVNLRDGPLRLYACDDFNRSQTYGSALLSGAATGPIVIDNQQQDRVFGIQFRSAGAFPFFRIPADETANTVVPLDDLWRSGASELRERLLTATSVESMIQVAESMLIAQAARSLQLHQAVNFALERFCSAPHTETMAAVSDRLGLSQRHFIAVFREQVGLTPKAFCKVRRFQYVLHSIHGASHIDWAQVALDSGYYDQAHFIHDFRRFSGLTPCQYWESRTPHLNHVPISA
ncbi:MAG: helix-turn-helix domain-containing protein [Acidobacteriaceae bacterium]